MKKNIIAGLDLGTTKVCAVIAEKAEGNRIDILGFGVAVSEGLHKGLVANIGKTAEAIRNAVQIASNRAGFDITTVNVGVAGEHITPSAHRAKSRTMTARNRALRAGRLGSWVAIMLCKSLILN